MGQLTIFRCVQRGSLVLSERHVGGRWNEAESEWVDDSVRFAEPFVLSLAEAKGGACIQLGLLPGDRYGPYTKTSNAAAGATSTWEDNGTYRMTSGQLRARGQSWPLSACPKASLLLTQTPMNIGIYDRPRPGRYLLSQCFADAWDAQPFAQPGPHLDQGAEAGACLHAF